MNDKNLIPISQRSEEELKAMRSKGGLKSVQKRREKKQLKEELQMLLMSEIEGQTVQEKISVALLKEAMNGNIRAFEIIRDTIGEKPSEKLALDKEVEIKITRIPMESINNNEQV